eukprot:TRINITY_DN4330_c0_g1_i3.p1 TRINITY_DN4330_c0_g1~~TRINITY_DN4330_c0_g1_i3.p1  ORF type:complete len:235 (+),score=34.65 TRINITY_DN4330_c0_g1_i3:173-877(+)
MMVKRSINDINKSLEDLNRAKIDKKDLNKFNNVIEEKINAKANMSDIKKAINETQLDIAQKLLDTETQITANVKKLKEKCESTYIAKADFDIINATLKSKVSAGELRELLAERATLKDLEQAYTKLKELFTGSKESTHSAIAHIKTDIEFLHSQVNQRPSPQISAQIPSSLFQTVAALQAELQSKAAEDSLTTFKAGQEVINEALHGEMGVEVGDAEKQTCGAVGSAEHKHVSG